jgi:acetyltransferase
MFDPFFKPLGVAIIGASRDPNKLGYGVVRNLTEYRYQGGIYPINPVASEILGHTCFPSVADVPDPVDLAVVVLPAPAVADVLEGCGSRGIKHAIIVSGGYAETGEEGQAREVALAQVAEEHGIRIMGPNCIGTIDTHTPVNTTCRRGPLPHRQPGQSGGRERDGDTGDDGHRPADAGHYCLH